MKQIYIFLVMLAFFVFIPAVSFGDCIEGNCQNGKGTYIYEDGSQFVGDWKGGKKHGQGTFTSTYGNKYVGAWERGMCHGKGKLFDGKGDLIKEGYWKYGMYTGEGPTDQ